ncbi:MAG: DedA family protein [Acidimicrobiales bacterium]
MTAILSSSAFISSAGYLAIFILSVAQSCCIPTSSELTFGFAGVLSATGHLNLFAAIGVGVVGEVIGAYIAWTIGRFGGRALVDRYGKYVLLTHSDLDRAEAWYQRHERWGVFGARLVPVIRNFVALPAGVAEVPLLPFGLLTAAGSLIWASALAGIGYGLGSHWRQIVHGVSDAGYVVGVLVVIVLAVFFVHRWRTYRVQRDEEIRTGRSGSHRAGDAPQSPADSAGHERSRSPQTPILGTEGPGGLESGTRQVDPDPSLPKSHVRMAQPPPQNGSPPASG